MARAAFLILVGLLGSSQAASAREAIYASAPSAVSVTVYRDPDRGLDQRINRDWPQGFAMISETRTIILPPGQSTIRFEGVSEGMVAVSAIVTGLPGGTIEKNRNAALLSPASLVDGTLGNRVTVTRTNPTTGQAIAENAIVRTRADGGIVLQTAQGYEAVQCAGIPEKLTFDRVPDGLSAQPVFSVDTKDDRGGTYQVTLTYISWGFDWQAHYVATFDEPSNAFKKKLQLRSWLTIVNNNGQDFPDATLLAVAGKLNIQSNFQGLATPPYAGPLSLTCYPIGHTKDGSPYGSDGFASGGLAPRPAPPMMAAPMMEQMVTVTAARMEKQADLAVVASEEDLGDLKLYRIPVPVTVAAKSMKQVAFLDRSGVEGEFQYRAACSPWASYDQPQPFRMVLRTKNDKKHGLGVALPSGGVTVFEPSSRGNLLVAEKNIRDYADGQDIDLELGESPNAFALCIGGEQRKAKDGTWTPLTATISNANAHPLNIRIELGNSADWKIRGKVGGLAVRDGQWSIERKIAAGSSQKISWEQRDADISEE